MDPLEHYHENPPQNEHYTLRKISLPTEGYINLYGARGSGKTAIILDYIDQSEKTPLYIDLEDPNLILNTLETLPLQTYIDENNIEELILDHYEEGMIDLFPRVKRLIILSRVPLGMPGFSGVQLFPLDYEEFLAFDSTANAGNAFNRFLKCGTLPAMAKQAKNTTLLMKQFFQQQFSPNEQALILILARYHTQPMTTHQIYSFAKEHFKISKDFVYSTVKRFQEEGLLYFIEDVGKRSGKKMIMYDFAFTKYLTVHQAFGVQFDSMVALTLLKHKVGFRTLGIHGYLTDAHELIIPAPFESEESFWVKAQKKFSLFKKHDITKITVISVANSYDFRIERLHFEAIPFNEWSISHTEEE
jgi:predicted AAA+ superfamily ATPase